MMTIRYRAWCVLATALAVMCVSGGAGAVHWFRGGSGCTAADGETTDAGQPLPPPAPDATVLLLHNTFNDAATAMTETRVHVGDAVRWEWSSSHCHSVTTSATPAGAGFDSGFHYPTAPPESPQVVPGFFEYPVPDTTPTLSYTHVFTAPGVYSYFCVHHAVIGMTARIVVEP